MLSAYACNSNMSMYAGKPLVSPYAGGRILVAKPVWVSGRAEQAALMLALGPHAMVYGGMLL
jgi:hypothetical protein